MGGAGFRQGVRRRVHPVVTAHHSAYSGGYLEKLRRPWDDMRQVVRLNVKSSNIVATQLVDSIYGMKAFANGSDIYYK